MSLSLPDPSSRLVRAAAAEQADLRRHRERLTRERDRLVVELRQLDDALAVLDGRLAMLAPLIEAPRSTPAHGELLDLATPETLGPEAPGPEATAAERLEDAREVLRGPAIREVAVQVLIAQPEHIEALHYRRWYELLQEAGYSVVGKDPLAVFLTQVSRSPVVRKATKPGVYEVDRQVPLRIRQRLERLQTELREVTVAPQASVELAGVRARRHELDLAIGQQERALEEAIRVLGRGAEDVPALGVTSSR
jgi:hypothetical protein